MTDPGVAMEYRYVSDGRMGIDLNRDATTRVKRPRAWAATALAGFGAGFFLVLDSSRDSLPHYRGEVIRYSLLLGLVLATVAVASGLAGVVIGRAANRLRMRRLFPAGSVTEVRLEQDAVVLGRPSSTRTIPYVRIRRIHVFEHTRWIVVRGRPTVEVLPGALLPAEAVEALQARAVGAVPLSWSSPTPTSHTRQMVVPDGWAAHVAVLNLRENVGRPTFWGRLGLAVLVSALVAYAAGGAWLLVGPALAVLALATGYVRTRRTIAAAQPPGSTASVQVLDDRMVSRTERWTREIRFEEVRGVSIRADVVFLTMKPGPRRLALARELVSDDVIERLRAATIAA